MMKRLAFLIGLFLTLSLVVVNAQTTDNTSLSGESSQRTGTLDDDTPFVEYALDVADDGSTIAIDLTAKDGTLDPVLYLLDENGNILAENDDRGDGTLDSALRFPKATAGNYTVIVTRFGVLEGDTAGEYQLDVSVITAVDSLPKYDITPQTLVEAGYPPIAPRPTADWTILAYYGGDTDLEAAIMNDFNEFEIAGGSDEQVRILVMLDRHPDFADGSGDWQSTRIFEVQADVSDDVGLVWPPTIDTEPLIDLGDLDTGNSETLAQFLTWGLLNFPAERYAVALSSHGAGWQGLITDYSSDTIIDVPGLSRAFQTARDASNQDRFDLLINDACSMSSIEYHTAMQDFFDVSIASPEITVDPALDMTLLTRTLRESPAQASASIGQALVDQYVDVDIRQRAGRDAIYLTQAVTDLQMFSPVVQAVEDFAEIINQDPARYTNLLGMARTNTYTYSFFIGQDSMIDLGHFMQQVIALSSEPELVRAARNVIQALEDARLYGSAGEWASDWTSYYNIYFPVKSADFSAAYFEQSPLDAWSQMLRNYFNLITPRLWSIEESILTYHPPIAPQVKVTQVYPDVSSSTFPPTVSMEVTGRKLSEGRFTIDRIDDQGRAIRLSDSEILTAVIAEDQVNYINSWRSGVDQSLFNWLPLTLPVVTDGETTANERLIRTGSVATLEGRYRQAEGDRWYDASVLFDLDGTVSQVVSRTATGALAPIRIPAGAEFQAYRWIVSSNGQIKAEPGTIYHWPADGLTWQTKPTPSGNYDLGFLVRSFGGTTGFDAVTVVVDNDDLDEAYRGYADVRLGLNFQHPADWLTPADFGDRLSTATTDGTERLNVYYFRTSDADFEVVLETFAEQYGVTINETNDIIEVSGHTAQTFTYDYQDTAGSLYQGQAFVVYRTTTRGERAIVFSLETTGSPDDRLFDHLTETTLFFDAVALQQAEDDDWRYDYLTQTLPYPVPAGWAVSLDEDGIWRSYAAPDDDNTVIAIANLDGDTRETILVDLLTTYEINDVLDERTYTGQYYIWQVATYRREGETGSLLGRFYVTRLNGQTYAYRMETPDDDNSYDIFRDLFEPMIDGFAPPSNVIFASGDVRPAFVKAAIVIANNICADADRNTLCYGDGQVKATTGSTEDFDTPGDNIDTADLETFDVGFADNLIDPFSIAVMTLQGTLPDNEPEQYARLTVFGGTTLFNHALKPEGTIGRIEITNTSRQGFNVRTLPDTNSRIETIQQPGETLQAIGINEDGDWIRVINPETGQTGWVFRDLFEVNDNLDDLPTSDPDNPFFMPMQAMEIFLSDDLPDDALNGVLIQTPPGEYTITLSINDALFEIEGGSMFFWRGDLGQIEAIDGPTTTDAFGQTVSLRRPAGWTSEVLRGAVRIKVRDADGEEVVIESSSGTAVSVDENNTVTVEEVQPTAEETIIAEAATRDPEDNQTIANPGQSETEETDDLDADSIPDDEDNCPLIANPDQTDDDDDGIGNACDPEPTESNDMDDDGIFNEVDNCPFTFNPDQVDEDDNGIGDACDISIDEEEIIEDPIEFDEDTDGDGIPDYEDNCMFDPNVDQFDSDFDGFGDVCDDDVDGDGVFNEEDNCPLISNEIQTDQDNDGIGDICDADRDGDGFNNSADSCPDTFGLAELGRPGCPDGDRDGWDNLTDNCPNTPNPNQLDSDEDSIGDACDADRDGDGFNNSADSCPDTFGLAELGRPGCPDGDGDGWDNVTDNCPDTPNPDQLDTDEDSIGDACDLPNADVGINVTMSPANPQRGDGIITFTVTLFNNGPSPATVDVFVGTTTTFCNNGGSGPAFLDPGIVVNPGDNIVVGTSQFNADDPNICGGGMSGGISNTNVPDFNPGNNSDSESYTVPPV
jgi:hypothetical protein